MQPHATRMFTASRHAAKRTAFLTCGIVLLSLLVFPGSRVVAQETLNEVEADELIEEIKRAAAEAQGVLEDRMSDHLFTDPVLDASAYEAELLLEWVIARTRWTPYEGILRGSDGVLMDRRGNTLDRALLLTRLLEDAGYETRLARTRLSRESAGALWERETSRAAGAMLPAEQGGATLQLDKDPGDSGALSRVSGIAEALADRITWDGPGEDRSRQIGAARDHWWVQVSLEGQWVDFDPLHRGDSAEARGEPQAFFDVAQLPAELFHGLRIQVVVERFEEGAVEEDSALELELSASDLSPDVPIELRFVPHSDSWPEEEQDERTVAVTATHWLPMAQHDNRRISGEWISDRGTLGESPSAYSGKEKVADAIDGLSALGAAARPAAAESQLTAVWLDYTILRPGRADLSVRREIFDLLGPHRRSAEAAAFVPGADEISDRGLALLGYTAILPLTSSPAPDAVNRAMLEAWAENRNPLIALVYRAAGREDDRVPAALAQLKYQPVDLVTIAALRQAWNAHAGQVFLDQINVLATHYIVREEAARLQRTMGVDVVAHGIGVIPIGKEDPRRMRVYQGVLDTFVESALFDQDEALNTFHLSLKEMDELSRWANVESAEDVSRLTFLSPASRARLVDVAESGNRAVVYPHAQAFGNVSFASWWDIDPRTGSTLGRGYRGWGAVIGETTIRNIPVHTAAKKAAEKTGVTVGCKMAVVATSVAQRVVIAKMHAAGQVQLPVRKFQKACYVLK